MPINENMVQEIVQEVMAKMQIADAPTGKHGIFKEMNDAIEAAKKSQLIVKKMSMDQREKIITCIRKKIKENAEVMARMGVEETGMGNVGDKILKHHLVADKTPGTEVITTTAWSGDRGLTLIEMGPFGVIGAITPCTNPSETILCNTMGMLAGGNTVVFNPHPAAIKTSIYAINLLNEASLESGGPDNIAVTVEKPTLETSNVMMKHKDIPLIAATGGPGVVTAVLSSGKRGIGAGAGNPPALVDETADIRKAATDIVNGCTFDNNLPCIAEKEIVAVSSIVDELMHYLVTENDCYLASKEEQDKLTEVVLAGGKLNRKCVGRDARTLLSMIGVNAPANIRCIVFEGPKEHPLITTELMMPILGVVRARDFDDAVEQAVWLEHGNRHSAHIHSKNEGVATYDALLYIPARAPFDYYSKDYEKGLQLYSSGVMIMEKCADLLPDWFSFVKGVVDSEDLSLNISRELLQQDRQLKIIAKNLEKSIKNELAKLLKNDREKYEKFYSVFGLQFKFGIYQSYGAANETLKDLLMFPSSFDGKNVTLKEYVSRMKEDQKEIYYACGETKERIEMLPQLEKIKDKGYEVLYFTQDVDEFAIKVMINYDGKPFKSISDADLDLDTEEEKEEAKKLDEENKDMFSFMQEAIADKVKTVRLSKKLKTHPVCLSSDGSITIEMEKVLNAMPQNDGNKVKAEKALEINPNHPIFEKLKDLYANDKDKLKDYAKLLYDQALLIEGMSIDNPVEFANLVCELMTK